ncbi:hypothetical protein LIER_18414 [Lithospermum erythrorhizon]|uniref:Uncharacterized protein n=1 Tax=Lithospermum erythrorhizon TaxID=34254 RepID=A0AAV3QI16_LITER
MDARSSSKRMDEASDRSVCTLHVPESANKGKPHDYVWSVPFAEKDLAKPGIQNLSFFKAIEKGKDFEWTEDCEQSFQELKAYVQSQHLLARDYTSLSL